MPRFFFNDTATTEIYTLSLQTLFRSQILLRHRPEDAAGGSAAEIRADRVSREARSEEHTSELQSRLQLGCRVFFLMIRRPPRSTLFPYRRSSDLKFFYDTDLKTRLEDRLPKFEQIVFHEKLDRKSTRLNSSHGYNSDAAFFF